jgi:hypothetical protein
MPVEQRLCRWRKPTGWPLARIVQLRGNRTIFALTVAALPVFCGVASFNGPDDPDGFVLDGHIHDLAHDGSTQRPPERWSGAILPARTAFSTSAFPSEFPKVGN